MCFAAAVLAFVAASKAVYGIFQIIAPGVFGTSGTGVLGVGGLEGLGLPPGVKIPDALGDLRESILALVNGGVSDSGDIARQQGIADLLSFGSLALASVLIFLRSWNWLPEHRE